MLFFYSRQWFLHRTGLGRDCRGSVKHWPACLHHPLQGKMVANLWSESQEETTHTKSLAVGPNMKQRLCLIIGSLDSMGAAGIRLTPAVFAGGLCGGRRLAALKEGGRLASVPEHLHGLVCDRAHLWPDQRRHHGHLHLRHPVSVQPRPERGRRKRNCASRKTE